MERGFLPHRSVGAIVGAIRRSQCRIGHRMASCGPDWAIVPDRLAVEISRSNPCCTVEPLDGDRRIVRWNDSSGVRDGGFSTL